MFILDNISFKYKEHYIFNNFNYKSNYHKIGIIGCNGVGKTTLLKILNRELKLENGKVVMDGSTYLSRYDFSKYGNFKVSELLDLLDTLESFNLSQLDYFLDLLHMGSYTTFRISELSQGTVKKIGVLLCLLSTRDYILLDEPFESLDQSSKHALIDYLNQCNRKFLIVDHDIDSVKSVSRDVINLDDIKEVLNEVK